MGYSLYAPGKRGRSWYLRAYHRGQKHEVSTGKFDRADAEKFAIDFMAQLARDHIAPEAQLTTDFPTALAGYQAFAQPRAVDASLFKRLARYFGETPIDRIDHKAMVEAAHKLYPGRSNATKNRNVIVPMAAILHYAGDLHRFPLFKVSERSQREPANPDDVGRLMRALKGHKRLVIAVLFETGLRITDALNLRARPGEGTPRIASIDKTDERILLALSPELQAEIAASPRYRGEFIFPWRTRSGVYKWLWPLRRKLKIEWYPHMSRHALATDLRAGRIPDRAAADHGGWKSVKSLHRYQHYTPVILEGRSASKLLQRTKG